VFGFYPEKFCDWFLSGKQFCVWFFFDVVVDFLFLCLIFRELDETAAPADPESANVDAETGNATGNQDSPRPDDAVEEHGAVRVRDDAGSAHAVENQPSGIDFTKLSFCRNLFG
jgi:hypothetical protein